jgi:hypothetical protein
LRHRHGMPRFTLPTSLYGRLSATTTIRPRWPIRGIIGHRRSLSQHASWELLFWQPDWLIGPHAGAAT